MFLVDGCIAPNHFAETFSASAPECKCKLCLRRARGCTPKAISPPLAGRSENVHTRVSNCSFCSSQLLRNLSTFFVQVRSRE